MKKKYIFLIFTLVFWGCQDDDEPTLDLDASSYSDTQLELSLNGIQLEGRTVKINPEKGTKAELYLMSLLPGEKETKIFVVGEKNEMGVSIYGSDENKERTLTVEGEINDSKLRLRASVVVHSEIVGKWKLPSGNQVPTDRLNNSAVYVDLVNKEMKSIQLPVFLSNGNVDANNEPIYDYPQIAFIEDPGDGNGRWFAECVMNGALSNFYSSLLPEIEFMANGHIQFTIVPWKGEEPIILPDGFIRYGIYDGKIWFMVENAEKNVNVGIAFLLKQKDGKAKIAIDKSLLNIFIELSPYLKALLNYQNKVDMFQHGKATEESIQIFVDKDMVDLLRSAEYFELGINLLPVQ